MVSAMQTSTSLDLDTLMNREPLVQSATAHVACCLIWVMIMPFKGIELRSLDFFNNFRDIYAYIYVWNTFFNIPN